MDNCIFCKIAKGDIPCNKVWEDEDLLCFLDITPFTKGHVMIIPKGHYPKITDIPTEIYTKLMLKAQELAKTIPKALNADAFNVFVIGEDVDHAHVHVVPRYSNDDSGFSFKKTENPEAKDFTKILEILKN